MSELIDLFFPPRPTELLIRTSNSKGMSIFNPPHSHQSVLYLLDYRNSFVSALLKENKYYASDTAATILARTLGEYLAQYPQHSVVCIPIPISAYRMKCRGYNQVTRILKRIPGIDIDETILTRVHHTKTQVALSRADRLENLIDAFACEPTALQKYSRKIIIVVDDVVTTGATMAAARAKLAPHLPAHTTLICLAIAH